jgi:hypothetical protein
MTMTVRAMRSMNHREYQVGGHAVTAFGA